MNQTHRGGSRTKTRVMKYETNFKEMSEIFGLIAKAEEKINAFLESRKNYDEASFNFSQSGYLAREGALMCESFDKMEKAEKSMKQSFKKVLVALGADTDCYEDKHLCEVATRTYEPKRFLICAKEAAMRLVRCVEI